MDRRIFSGGAIVCSTVVLWTQPSAPNDLHQCVNNENDPATRSLCTTLNGQSSVGDHRQSLVTSNRTAPESLSDPKWSEMQLKRLPDEMESVYENLLKQAQVWADRDRLADAVTTIAGVPTNSRHHAMAQQLQEDWSQQLLQQAVDRSQQGKISDALAMLDSISSTSQQQPRVSELRRLWQQQAGSMNQAIAAKNAGNWQGVITALESLKETPLFHSQPVQSLLQRAINNHFQPNNSMMRLAVVLPGQASTPAPAPALPATIGNPTSQPVDLLPAVPAPEIDLAQAMAWAQPAASPSIALSQPRSRTVASRPDLSAELSQLPQLPQLPQSPAPQPSVAPPSIAALPKTPTSPKITQPSEFDHLPVPSPILATEPSPAPAID